MTTLNLKKTGLLVFCLVLCTLFGKSQINANFTATPTEGCAPLVVHFTDASTGNPTQWKWDLGNGTISFLQNPSVTYFTPGQYNIKLVVSNAQGADSVVRIAYIRIYDQPVINFSATPTNGCFPLNVQFTDLSNPISGSISAWQWDFGDGTFDTTQNPSHIYTASGNFNVSLVATNSHGCFKSITKSQYITVAPGVDADFTNSSQTGCNAPSTINFQNTSQGTGNLTYHWNFGDGATSSDENPNHVYASTGNYTVTLIATNTNGCSDTVIRPNAVSIGAIHSDFTAPDSACRATSINFANISTPAPGTAFWDFGDGTTSTNINPQKTYLVAGTYTVKLINNFGACIDSVEKQIVITPSPTVNFSTPDTVACNTPFTVHFTNTSTGADTYTWYFGDGATSTDINPIHTYSSFGNFNVRLVAFNNQGCSNNTTKNSFIRIQRPVTNITQLPQEGCAPFEWTFNSNTSSSEPVTSYFWDFGDGSTSTDANPTHIFAQGTYDIKLIVTTASGCTDTVIVTNGIKAGNKPNTGFNANPLSTCAYVPVNFFDTTLAPVDRWLWDFGDGYSSTVQNPIHTYADTGYFNVTLIVWNNGCSDTLEKVDYVHINPPIAVFTSSFSCATPLVRTFTDHSVGADTWAWDFGDGTTSSDVNPVHTFPGSGTYNVTLTVTNLITGCSYEAHETVRIINETPDITASQTTVCRNTPVIFSVINTVPGNVTSYNWTFGDGTGGNGINKPHAYSQSGVYDVRMILIDRNGCLDTVLKPQYITVNGPTAGFTVSPTTSCLMADVNFTDTSHSDGTHPITSWIWNFGDGNTQTYTAGPFVHHYNTGGVYTVSLTVTDAVGCTDSLATTNAITVSRPVAQFYSPDTLSCPGKNIRFINSSTGNNLTYNWSFGDGSITNHSQSPVYTYSADGVYPVKLVVFDQFGCSDSLTKPAYITIASPVANFTVSDSLGTCPPLIVTFTNTSSNYTSYSWDFGDGSTSNLPTPSHFYDIPGEYFAKLTVTGPGGCTAVKTQRILVRGPYGHFTYNPLVGCTPMQVQFTGTTQGRLSFVWDFNDGSTLATTDSIVSHSYTTPGFYVPKMLLIDNTGCTVAIQGTDTIKVYGVTADMSFNPPVVCDSGTVVFTNHTTSNDVITGYLWNFGDGATSTASDTTHYYANHGIYNPTLVVTTQHGCRDTAFAGSPLKIVGTPRGIITQSNNGCTPVSITFTGSLQVADTSAINWNWNFGNGQTNLTQNPPAVLYQTAGTYNINLVVTNSLGCSDTVQTQIEAYPIPQVQAGADITSCVGTGKILQATGADSYVWTPSQGLSCINCSSPLANPAQETDYIVKGTTIHGCSASDTIKVKVAYPIHLTVSPGDSICRGNAIALSASGASSYQWWPADGLSSTTGNEVAARPLATINYQVIGSDDVGCFKDTAHIPVRVFNIPTVNAGPDATINVGQSIDLIPQISSDVTSATWSPTGGQFRSDWPSITVRPRETTTYTIDVANAGGCTARSSRTVYVICNGANVFIPNTFSPNADGANDIFYVRGTGLFNIKTIKIFNRWGEMVYAQSGIRPNDANTGWDGTFKGQKLNPDVFVYVIEITCDNNSVLTYKGNIALIK